jgi:hypothetical protein
LVIDPEALAIVSSGYSDNPVMANYIVYGFSGVMPKPYRIEEMVAEIERVFSGKWKARAHKPERSKIDDSVSC